MGNYALRGELVQEDVLYWLWLQKGLGFGANIRPLLDFFGSARAVYEAGENEWRMSGLFGGARLELKPAGISGLGAAKLSDGERVLSECEKIGLEILTPKSEDYPKLLRRIVNPPAVLYVKGDSDCLNAEPAIGVVGTRRPSEYGVAAARKIALGLCEGGAMIVSGGALGIDSVAHSCALESGKKTVLVMGCPHTSEYLKENESLRLSVSENGALVSEYPPLTRTFPALFPLRNRIISGMSRAVVIVEAGAKSGSLNTANHAFSQGKDVFAVPGDIGSVSYYGSNAVLLRGGKPVFSAGDVLKFYSIEERALKEISRSEEKEPFFGIESYPFGEPEADTPKNAPKRQSNLSKPKKNR